MDAARTLFEESLSLSRMLGDRPGMAAALNNLGGLAQLQSDLASARAAFEEALTLVREIGDPHRLAAVLGNLGTTAMNQGDYEGAAARLGEVVALWREVGNDLDLAMSLNNLGLVTCYQENAEAAERLFLEALERNRRLEARQGEAQSLAGRGMVARRRGDFAEGWSCYEQALKVRHRLGEKRQIAEVLECIAVLITAWGESQASLPGGGDRMIAAHRASVRLCAVAHTMRDEIKVPSAEHRRALHEQDIAAARAALGEDAFGAAWAEGRDMTLEEAVAYALGDEMEALRDALSVRPPQERP